MIGNDIVDLELALKESNWKRKGFLDKIFTKNEQLLILKSDCPNTMVWNLWSRKEASYKIYNRITRNRIYNPIQFECFDFDESYGIVENNGSIYFTKTESNSKLIHTVSVLNLADFDKIKYEKRNSEIIKINGIPFLRNSVKNELNPISISNHGRFEKIVSLLQSQPTF
jgi:phosphopantetheinyl transferase (holo-ACP synthase)